MPDGRPVPLASYPSVLVDQTLIAWDILEGFALGSGNTGPLGRAIASASSPPGQPTSLGNFHARKPIYLGHRDLL